MNRAVRKTILFENQQDYEAFLAVVREGLSKFKIRVIAYELMPNHWHFVVICDRIPFHWAFDEADWPAEKRSPTP